LTKLRGRLEGLAKLLAQILRVEIPAEAVNSPKLTCHDLPLRLFPGLAHIVDDVCD
jgi:hypothetical protein